MTQSGHVWQAGVVVSRIGPWVRVRFEPLTHCDRCLRGEGCGAGVFSRLFAGRRAELQLTTDLDLEPGQPVRVGLPSAALVGLAAWMYGLPVVVFILAAAAAATLPSQAGSQDALALAVGLAAAATAVVLAARRGPATLQPRLEALPSAGGCAPLESDPD